MVKLKSSIFIGDKEYECISNNNDVLVLKLRKEKLPQVRVKNDLAILKDVTLEELLQFKERYKQYSEFVSDGIMFYVAATYLGCKQVDIVNATGRSRAIISRGISNVRNSNKLKDKAYKVVLALVNWKK
jgi:hypothetical protein